MKQHLKLKDLLWVLAYPVYQLIGTFRHEAAHAVVAVLEGARITEFVFWPTAGHFGYVNWTGNVNWVATAAPYLCDLITFIVFFVICTRVRFKRHWVWINLVIIGLISPLVNSAWNYRGAFKGGSDASKLLVVLPDYLAHTYFVLTLLLYTVGLFWALRPKSKQTANASD